MSLIQFIYFFYKSCCFFNEFFAEILSAKYLYPTIEDDKMYQPSHFLDTDCGMKGVKKMYRNGIIIHPAPEKIKFFDDFHTCSSFIYTGITGSPLTPLNNFVALHYYHHDKNSHINRMDEIKRLKSCPNLYSYVNFTSK